MSRTFLLLAVVLQLFTPSSFGQDDISKAELLKKLEATSEAMRAQKDLELLAFSLGNTSSPETIARIAKGQIDLRFPSLRWSRVEVIGTKDKQSTVAHRERIIQACQLSKEEAEKLDVLFRERLEVWKKHSSALAADAKIENVDIELVIAEYKKLETQAERELCKRLRDILDPEQFSTLVKQWGKTLDMPIIAVFLDLSDKQIASVTYDASQFEKLKIELAKKAMEIDPKAPSRIIGSNPDLYRAMYKQYLHLTTEQFLRASILLTEWKGCRTFTDRLDSLAAENAKLTDQEKVRMKIELEVLGDLYRKGAEEEKAKK